MYFVGRGGGTGRRQPVKCSIPQPSRDSGECILSFGHGSRAEFAVGVFRAECNKNHCFPQGKRERRFYKTDL